MSDPRLRVETELPCVSFALPVQSLGATAWPRGCLGLIPSGVICLCPSSPIVPSSSSCHHPPQTSSFTWLDATPHPTGPWTVGSSSVSCVMGERGPPSRLLLLPFLLTVGGEFGASAAPSRVPGLSLGQGREKGGET